MKERIAITEQPVANRQAVRKGAPPSMRQGWPRTPLTLGISAGIVSFL
jgi:hypothetical protein